MIKKIVKSDVQFIAKHTLQPKWWKIAKIFILLGLLISFYFIFGVIKTAVWFVIFFLLSLIVHFTYRIKTHAFTRPWMDFKVKEAEGELAYGRIGLLYYSLVTVSLLMATATLLLI